MMLNIKQFDTEETCMLPTGQSLSYTWRTHKKKQLLQLFIPKYAICSTAFQINKNGYDEVLLKFKNKALFISCIVGVYDADPLR